MSFGEILYVVTFYFFVMVTIISALVVAMSRNIVYSAFALLVTFFSIAGIYVFLTAEFLAIAQIVIYVGGILVLILFAIMLTNKIKDVNLSNPVTSPYIAAPLVLVIFFGLVALIMLTPWAHLPAGRQGWGTRNVGAVQDIGNALLGNYLLLFEVAAMLLLGVLLGAAYLARRMRTSPSLSTGSWEGQASAPDEIGEARK